jgi:tetratricopeptide (TPR) repeat protein
MVRRLAVLAVFFCELLAARTDTLLILPFSNSTKDSSLDWIGESISESVREVLSSEGVLVLERNGRQEAYRRLGIRQYAVLTRASVIHIAQSLDAAQVIYGEFQVTPMEDPQSKSRGALRVSASVLNLRAMKRGPRFEEVGPLEDLAGLQNRIAWSALKYTAPEAATSEQDFHAKRPPVRVEAIEAYIRGLLATSADQKFKLFTQSVRLDPNFSQPCFHLGRLHWDKKDYKLAAEWLEKVNTADAHFRESRFYLGLCRFYLREYPAAERSFQVVASSVPLNEVYNNLGAAQLHRSPAAALDSFRKALEGDSNDPDYQFNVGYALWMLNDFENAAQQFRAVLDRSPTDTEAMLMLGKCIKSGRPAPKTDTRTTATERLKHDYQETVFWQLKAALEPSK